MTNEPHMPESGSQECADELYDMVSELLRDRRVDPADDAFGKLDAWLRTGGTLPSPWQN